MLVNGDGLSKVIFGTFCCVCASLATLLGRSNLARGVTTKGCMSEIVGAVEGRRAAAWACGTTVDGVRDETVGERCVTIRLLATATRAVAATPVAVGG